MRRRRTIPRGKNSGKSEEGIVIVLVAIVLLFIVGAMAALAIDLVTFYTARSEAQVAADGAALAGARVLANTGMTSGPAAVALGATPLAAHVAAQVAASNEVGGRVLSSTGACPGAEVCVSFPNIGSANFTTNPWVSVKVQRTDLPTFFARIWGRATVTVTATATAEAYNPSGVVALGLVARPVAPSCVKPWLLPNMDPTGTSTGVQIFNSTTGAISNPLLVGQTWPNASNTIGLVSACAGGDCSVLMPAPIPGRYYPGVIGATDFPVPTQSLPSGSTGFTNYQLAVAGCVPRPIQCGPPANANIDIDTTAYAFATTDRNADTVQAVSSLIHYNGAVGDTDSIDPAVAPPPPPFQFLAGNGNPAASGVGKDILVSDSLVTVPVYDSTPGVAPTSGVVNVIGFLQLFLNPNSATLPVSPNNDMPATIVNMVGCGTGAAGPPILGNGASAVAVRLCSVGSTC